VAPGNDGRSASRPKGSPLTEFQRSFRSSGRARPAPLVDEMVTERAHRRTTAKAEASFTEAIRSAAYNAREAARSMNFNMKSDANQASDDQQPSADTESRDIDMIDEIWDKLQQDKQTAEAAEKANHELLSEKQNLQKQLQKLQKETPQNKLDGDDEAAKRYEQARLQHELERRKHEEELGELQKRRGAIEQKHRKEQQVQKRWDLLFVVSTCQ
jgi:hypothetical protein